MKLGFYYVTETFYFDHIDDDHRINNNCNHEYSVLKGNQTHQNFQF